jgi:hypothetical protein
MEMYSHQLELASGPVSSLASLAPIGGAWVLMVALGPTA